MQAQLVHKGEQPYFIINDKEFVPNAYVTYAPDAARFAQMRKLGIRLFSFTIFIGDNGINDYTGLKPFSKGFFVGEGRYDFSDVDRILDMVAPEGEEVYLFPRVYLDAPNWWLDSHPDERCQNQSGQRFRQSFASETWREDMWEAVQALIDHIQSTRFSNNVIGFHLGFGGTEECVYQTTCNDESVDMSPVNFQRYLQWRQEQDLPPVTHFPSPLQRRYGMNGVLRDPVLEADTVNYYHYHNYLIADTICYFSQKVKDYTQNRWLTGAFYGYIFSNYDFNKGHHAVNTILHCPYLDFVSSTNGPNMEGQSWPFSSVVDSFRLHGKLWFAEGDIRTHCYTGMSKYLSYAAPLSDYYDNWPHAGSEEMGISMMRKAAARTLTGHAGLWWFDLFGDWFDAPALRQVISANAKWMKQQSDGPLSVQVAVLVDEDSMKLYAGSKPEVLQQVIDHQRAALMRAGFPYHTYILQDVTDPAFDPDQYKLYIILGAVSPSEQVKTAINTRLKSGGRTLLWVHLADIYSDNPVTGFKVTYDWRDDPRFADAPLRNANRQHRHVQFPGKPVSCGRFAPEEWNIAYQIATFADSTEPAMLAKVFPGKYTSIFSLLPAIPHQLLKELASESGVHIYNQDYGKDDDCVFAGGRFLGLCSTTDGVKRLYLPEGVNRVLDADTGHEVEIRNQFIDFIAKAHETKLFIVE